MASAVDDWSIQLPGKHWSFRGRGLVASIVMVAAGFFVLASVPTVAEGSWLDEALDVLGWVVFVAGAGIRFWATLYIGARKEWTLVSEGPYSLCRNPLYVGSLLMLLSIGVFLDSLTFLVITSVMVPVYMRGTVRAEEETLRKTLGQDYIDYCQRVPRFWPRLSGFQTPDMISVRVKGLRLECMRMLRWMLLPLSMEILSKLREYPWWPHLLRLP